MRRRLAVYAESGGTLRFYHCGAVNQAHKQTKDRDTDTGRLSCDQCEFMTREVVVGRGRGRGCRVGGTIKASLPFPFCEDLHSLTFPRLCRFYGALNPPPRPSPSQSDSTMLFVRCYNHLKHLRFTSLFFAGEENKGKQLQQKALKFPLISLEHE